MFWSRTVTLTVKDTLYTLKQLMQAACVAGEDAPVSVSELKVTADSANAGSVLMGDKTLTDANYGVEFNPGDSFIEGAGNLADSISTNALNFKTPAAGADGMKLHIHARII